MNRRYVVYCCYQLDSKVHLGVLKIFRVYPPESSLHKRIQRDKQHMLAIFKNTSLL